MKDVAESISDGREDGERILKFGIIGANQASGLRRLANHFPPSDSASFLRLNARASRSCQFIFVEGRVHPPKKCIPAAGTSFARRDNSGHVFFSYLLLAASDTLWLIRRIYLNPHLTHGR